MTNVVPFDTLALASALRDEAGLDQQQAEGFARVLSRALVGDMATKADLVEAKTELKAEIKTTVSEAKADIIKWMFGTIVAQTALIIAAVKLLH
ncbi:hypothetical protein [Phaeospirillum tilakii]|uniref:DUF1640 domain-containing protein n=1 Tax=Phaeospirillum tilakii TaxID=741673 RepID=A0ABW5CDX4_9PROT